MELSNYKPSLPHQKNINAESLKTSLGLCAFYPLKILRAFAFLHHFNIPESIQSISAKALYPLPILLHNRKVFLFHQSIHIFSLT